MVCVRVELDRWAVSADRRLWTVAAWCLAFIIPVWWWTPSAEADRTEPETAAVVRDYLEAIRGGDVRTALNLIDVRPPVNETTFLTPRALDRGWSIGRLVVADESVSTATVDAVIVSDGGTRASGSFGLKRTAPEDRWRLDMPLIEAVFQPTPLDSVEVNGVSLEYVPRKDSVVLGTAWPSFWLFPGVYRFYSDVPGLLDAGTEPVPVLPQGATYRSPPPLTVAPPVELTGDGVRRVQEAVNAYLDDCAEKTTRPSAVGCPFGLEYPFAERGFEWRIEKYPVVAAVAGAGAFQLTHRETGLARFTAPGPDGGTCPVNVDWLLVRILFDGELQVFPRPDAVDPQGWVTC